MYRVISQLACVVWVKPTTINSKFTLCVDTFGKLVDDSFRCSIASLCSLGPRQRYLPSLSIEADDLTLRWWTKQQQHKASLGRVWQSSSSSSLLGRACRYCWLVLLQLCHVEFAWISILNYENSIEKCNDLQEADIEWREQAIKSLYGLSLFLLNSFTCVMSRDVFRRHLSASMQLTSMTECFPISADILRNE